MIILSNNQWDCDENAKAWIARGEDCSAEARVGGLVRAYLSVMPDVICLQESSQKMGYLMMREIHEQMKEKGIEAEYAYVSGRDTPIVYRSDLYNLKESGFLLYPDSVPGYDGVFNNSESKSFSWCLLEERKSGRLFAAMSTHLWWKSDDPERSDFYPHSDEARTWQLRHAAGIMNRVMTQHGCPVFLMGDFNADMNSLCVRTAYADGWRDVHDVCVGKCDDSWGYHHCGWDDYSPFEWKPFEKAIDHILFKSPLPVTVKRFERVMPAWFDCISDHYPLYTEVDW